MKIDKKKIDKKNIIIAAITLVVGLGFGWVIFGGSSETAQNQTEIAKHDHENEVGVWTCSMHPQIRMDKPGQCPICGMDLIPLEQEMEELSINPDEIQMSEAAMKLAEIQTARVKKGIPEREVYLLGVVKPDERNISEITARFGGRIEELNINFTGQNVRKGEKLATLYSPELISAQRELLEAIKYKETNPGFYKAVRTKLLLWDLTEEQINGLETSGETQHYFSILSPISGTVTKREVSIGDYVKVGMPMFEVIDLSKLWVMFDAYESDLPWIGNEDKIDFSIQSLPGRNFSGKVKFIDPLINEKTRVAKVRVELNNSKQELKPEMFANGILRSKIPNTSDLLIPNTSILWTGKRAVVYVKVPARSNPTFAYREIVLGPQAGNFYVVESGLEEGEEIAVNGVFKIDAAAQLAGKPSMMNPGGGKVSTGHNHGGTPMSDAEMENMDDRQSTSKNVAIETSMDFKMQLGKVVDNYLLLKDALVASNEGNAGNTAKKTLDALDKVDMTLLKGNAHNQWMKFQKPIKDNLNGIVQMQGIEMKRSHFSVISNKLAEAIEEFGLHGDQKLYLEFCPMDFDNKGGYWISESKEIRNPYFGEKMMKCGEVKKEL
jgi:Cu(I)/Ag(I) efflux system membrane fusion protein